ncbi:DNA phosphorothioation-associated putative methyltransferase [Micromonospora profundi]|uniref:DNA phosphorothioation-associated putative methyltransferase n=1 Tax=Micromonospora profundi TaxID=1420889 RepID=UPI002FF23752
MTSMVARQKTAMTRQSLSRPLATAIGDGIVHAGVTVFDYGCGRGGDLRRLADLDIACSGWDPAHLPSAPRVEADIVNLGYVLNVIEDPGEREQTLTQAWALARDALIVSARLTWDSRGLTGRAVGDGFLTSAGTFQKFYTQHELRAWIESVLQAPTLAAGPGIMYVFRDPATAQSLLIERVRRASRPPEPWISAQLLFQHQDLLAPLVEFLTARGRLPRGEELPQADAIKRRLGSIARAHAIITSAGPEKWVQLRHHHSENLLVYAALALFDGRPRFTHLSPPVRNDIREFFGTYKQWCARADRLLVSAGRQDLVDLALCASPVGKLTPSALYVHTSALGQLPPLLRVLEGCAQTFVGSVPGSNLIKLHRGQPVVSYLTYPTFDSDAHPTLSASVVVNLRKLTIDLRDYRTLENPPLLHRKEEFLSSDHPDRPKYERLTVSERRHGLYDNPELIGNQNGWVAAVRRSGVEIRGHRLYRARTSPTIQ